ncbi:MAG: DoxX family protein [Pedosphaera sp.]|nr:DoxX family protein [Pedosphaera sp.]
MTFPRPFAGLDRRIAWLRAILLSACFLGMLFSEKLWLNTRDYPLLKITPGFPVLPAPLDKIFFIALLLSLVLAGWFHRRAVLFFLFGTLFLFLEDQNRGQPWFYMYWVMLWLTLLPAPVALAACRCALTAVYLWSGIQKCHATFFERVPVWLSAPAANWHLPGGHELVRYAIAGAPFIEIFIGLAFWIPRLRKLALGIVIAVHVLALLLLGPTGLNYNLVVWPWNLAMIALALVLFAAAPQARLKPTFTDLRQSKPALTVVALFSLLPILSYAGMWDSYFSFSLFAEHEAKADMFMSEAMTKRLPEPMRKQLHQLPAGAYNPQVQGPYAFGFQVWAYEQLGVPAISEPRSFRSVYNFLYKTYAAAPTDLHMLISPRSGPITFYEAHNSFALVPNK